MGDMVAAGRFAEGRGDYVVVLLAGVLLLFASVSAAGPRDCRSMMT